jgi:lysozyme family protein
MDSNFEKYLPAVLKHEGGYVNDPRDPGGATNKGVTIKTFRSYVNPKGTIEDLKALTVKQAGVVYRRQYWDTIMGASLPSGVDYAVFDISVNSGPPRAAKMLQKALGVTVDGKIGPATLAAARGMPKDQLINRICDARLAFMQSIKRGSLWKAFGKGWSRRVKEVRAMALNMAHAGAPSEKLPPEFEKPATPVPAQNAGNGKVAVGGIAGALAVSAAWFYTQTCNWFGTWC